MIRNEIGKIFPNINSTLAYYSPTSFYITLNKISEAEFKSFSTAKLEVNNVKDFSIFIHELRHYIDHISTLWGQKHILKLFDAVNARIGQDEYKFQQILPLKIAEMQFHYDLYYTVQNIFVKWKSINDNWKLMLTTGIKFDTNGLPDKGRPILFVNFSTQDNQHLVRVPLSIAALLETNAVKDELGIRTSFISTLKEDEGFIEAKLFENEILSNIIYNQKLAVYNSIVHLTANSLQLTNVAIAFEISSAIATLALNLPNKLIENLPIDKTPGERIKPMLKNQEYSVIFLVLLNNYKDFYLNDKIYNLDRLLLSNNLPTKNEIEIQIKRELNDIKIKIKQGVNFKTNFTNILNEGERIFDLRGIDGLKINTENLFFKHGVNPNVICNDTDFDLEEYIINSSLNIPMDNLTMQQWYSFALTIDDKLNEFFHIRGL